MERTNIYLTEEQQRRLSRRAKAEGVTKSTIVRQILDEALAISVPLPSAENAVAESFGIWSDRSETQLDDVLEWRREVPLQRLTR
ncbi:MAG: CopG family transcriptional regulator [Acidimicrobiia bacterium]